jgi:hypothetical protein
MYRQWWRHRILLLLIMQGLHPPQWRTVEMTVAVEISAEIPLWWQQTRRNSKRSNTNVIITRDWAPLRCYNRALCWDGGAPTRRSESQRAEGVCNLCNKWDEWDNLPTSTSGSCKKRWNWVSCNVNPNRFYLVPIQSSQEFLFVAL